MYIYCTYIYPLFRGQISNIIIIIIIIKKDETASKYARASRATIVYYYIIRFITVLPLIYRTSLIIRTVL